MMSRFFAAVLFAAASYAATFGTPVPVAGGPIDLVLDERRNQLYLVDFNTNSVRVYSIPGRRFLPSIPVGNQPVSAVLSPDGKHLYVTNFGSSTLSVIDLDQNGVVRTVSLRAQPEGVAVGGDGRVLITTLGLGPANNRTDTLMVFDPQASAAQQVMSVAIPPPPPVAPPLQPTPGRIYLSFRGRLQATPDGRYVIGVNTPTNNSTVVFVYEVASGTVLRTRTVPGLSTVLSVSHDGSRFMAGLTLFDTATLNVLAQANTANANFLLPATFNIAQNVGGSVFSPDGSTLYGAFNVAPLVTPQPRPNSSTLLISNPRNLGIRLGIQLPESVLGKMVSTSDGSVVYALSESGFLILPVGQLNNFPIVMPETTSVRLASNQCDQSAASRTLRILNAGRGTLRFSVQAVAANTGLAVQVQGAQAPGNVRFSMNPATARRIGTTTTIVQLQSQDAINIPPVIRVHQNWLNAETRTTTIPIERNISDNEGLVESLLDAPRQRLYIANSGKNQIEVFDLRRQQLLDPIEVGQFPRSMAMGTDGRTLYVANSGGEWISMVDLDEGREYDRISFPPTPFNANQAPFTARVIANGVFGLQIFASTGPNAAGTLWRSSGKTAVLRPLSNAIGTLNIPAPVSMVSTPGGEAIMLLAGNNTAYLYDSMADEYVLARQVMSAPVTSYYGAVGAGPEGRYFLANRAILNSTLVPIGGYAGGIAITPQPLPPVGGGQLPGGGQIPGGGQAPGGGGQFPGGGIVPGGGLPTPGQQGAEEEPPTPEQEPPPDGQEPPVGDEPPAPDQQRPPDGQQPPGQQPPVPVTPANLRNVSAVAPVNATVYARFSTPQQANANAAPTGNPQPMVELVNINTEAVIASAPVSEGPAVNVFGNARANIPGRMMAMDTRSMVAYVLTASGLSIASLAPGPAPTRITVAPQGVVNAASYATSLAPGALFSIFGQNLAGSESAPSLPLPTLLGGSCVTINDQPVPLIMTSPGQINGQIPPNLRAGTYTLVVRSVENFLASNTASVRVTAAAPAVFANPASGEAALFNAEDFSLVTRNRPARRDQAYILFATGIPPAAGAALQPGAPAPSSPLAETQRVKVFIGDPRISESEMIVEWSGFAPGFVGLNQINIRVHGDRIRGDNLPVSIRVGNTSSPLEGPLVPVTFVR